MFYINRLGKPAYHMFKNDVDWAPTLQLGHQKFAKKVKVRTNEIGEWKPERES